MQALPMAAHAEPSAEFLECQRMLADKAETHRAKADKLKRKFDASIDKLIQKAVKNSAEPRSSEEVLRESVERIKEWHEFPAKQLAYVDKTIERYLTLPEDRGAATSCPDSYLTSRNYKVYLDGYDEVLDLVEDDVKARTLLEEIRDDEGLLVIAFNSTELDLRVLLNRKDATGGNIEFRPLRRGQYFRVVRAKAGTYYWDRINQSDYQYKRWFELNRFDLEFEVEAGKLNYAGVFMFEASGGRFHAILEDRLVITLAILEHRYPELIAQYEIANGLHPDDRFMDFYLAEKRIVDQGSANENHK